MRKKFYKVLEEEEQVQNLDWKLQKNIADKVKIFEKEDVRKKKEIKSLEARNFEKIINVFEHTTGVSIGSNSNRKMNHGREIVRRKRDRDAAGMNNTCDATRSTQRMRTSLTTASAEQVTNTSPSTSFIEVTLQPTFNPLYVPGLDPLGRIRVDQSED